MTADYITLANGQKYRVEVNLNSLMAFCEKVGIEDLSEFDNIAKIKIPQLPFLIRACIAEGELVDGREFALNDREVAAQFRTNTIVEFFTIYRKQATISHALESTIDQLEGQKKRNFNPFRKKS